MKKIILLLMSFTLCTMTVSAQKLKKNEVDKFSNSTIKETSTETLFTLNPMGIFLTHRFMFALRQVDGQIAMPASITLYSIEKYDEESGVTFLLDNGEKVELTTLYTGIGAKQIGAKGGYEFDTCFNLSEKDVELLKEHKVVSIRISYMGGHFDNDIKPKKQGLIQKMLALFDK